MIIRTDAPTRRVREGQGEPMLCRSGLARGNRPVSTRSEGSAADCAGPRLDLGACALDRSYIPGL